MEQKKERVGAKKKQISSASGSQSKRSRGVDIILEGDLEDDNNNEFMDTMGMDSMDSRFASCIRVEFWASNGKIGEADVLFQRLGIRERQLRFAVLVHML